MCVCMCVFVCVCGIHLGLGTKKLITGCLAVSVYHMPVKVVQEDNESHLELSRTLLFSSIKIGRFPL